MLIDFYICFFLTICRLKLFYYKFKKHTIIHLKSYNITVFDEFIIK